MDDHRVPEPGAIDADTVERFGRRGFLAIDRLIDDDTVDRLRRAYDDLIAEPLRADGDRLLGDVIRQIMFPSENHPAFRANGALDAGRDVARRLLGREDVDLAYEMLIDKPPGQPHETPWHQDAGYWVNPVLPAGSPTAAPDLQFWLALDDADEDNGCMWFVPGVHTAPSLAHEVVSGDPAADSRLIAIEDLPMFEAANPAVPCPVRAGGCTVHTPGTPHRTGPNLSNRSRRAYIFNLGSPAVVDLTLAVRSAQLEDIAARRVAT